MGIKKMLVGTLLTTIFFVNSATQNESAAVAEITPLKIFCTYSVTWNNFPFDESYLSKIDNLCSYLVLGHIKAEPNRGLIIGDNSTYPAASSFNNTKVLLTIYFPVPQTNETYMSEDERKALIKLIIQQIRSFDYDGVQLDYGAYTNVSDRSIVTAVREEVVQDFRNAFDEEAIALSGDKPKLILALDSPATSGYFGSKVNLSKVAEISDWILFVNDNYYEPVKHLEALNLKANETIQPDQTIFLAKDEDIVNRFVLNEGIKSEKLILGLFTVAFEITPSKSFVVDGLQVRHFYQICEELKSEWTMVYINGTAPGAYAIRGNKWIFIQDATAVKIKTQFAINNHLGGISILLNGDDYNGKCYNKTFPLTEAAKEAIST